MPSARWIQIVIALSALTMLTLSLLSGKSLDGQFMLQKLGIVTSLVTLSVLAFDRWLWRQPVARLLAELLGVRVIHGTWKGVLKYERDADGNPGQKGIYMAISQTYSTVAVRCYFPGKDSTSESVGAVIEPGPHRHTLRYIYRQLALHPDRDANRPTEGVSELFLVGRPVQEISGSYFAERNNGKGRIVLTEYTPKVAGSLRQAEALSYRDMEAK